MRVEEVDDFLSTPGPALVSDARDFDGHTLVLGAGGKMGLHLAVMLRRALDRAGRTDRVWAVSRFGSVHGREAFHARGVETIACDLTSDESVGRLPDAPNVVFMAGAKFGTTGRGDVLHLMNAEVPERMARRFPHSRFLVFSTGCVYSLVAPESGGSTEESATEPPGAYARSCLEREEAFVRAARERGLQSCLLRLNYSTEFRYGVLVDIALKTLSGAPLDLSMGYVNVIWQRDAVEHILRCRRLATAEPAILNIAGPDVVSVRSLAQRFGGVTGVVIRH